MSRRWTPRRTLLFSLAASSLGWIIVFFLIRLLLGILWPS